MQPLDAHRGGGVAREGDLSGAAAVAVIVEGGCGKVIRRGSRISRLAGSGRSGRAKGDAEAEVQVESYLRHDLDLIDRGEDAEGAPTRS